MTLGSNHRGSSIEEELDKKKLQEPTRLDVQSTVKDTPNDCEENCSYNELIVQPECRGTVTSPIMFVQDLENQKARQRTKGRQKDPMWL